MPRTSLVLLSLIFSSLIRHHLSGPFLRLTRSTAPDRLDCLFTLGSVCLSGGGVGKPGLGIASKGTLVGGSFRRSEAGDCSERMDVDELDGESSDDVEGSRRSGDEVWLPLVASLELTPLNRGLGVADILGLGAGLDRTL